MTPPEKPFLRLPARRRGVIRRASLWDAGDYLLSISGTTFSERYRRFYYRDIQSIVVQNGPRLGSIGAMLLTLWFTVVLLALAVTPNMPSGFRWVLLLPLLWLVWLIYANLARSCRVFLFTAVSSEELPAIFRRRSAAKALPKILNKIAEAQGDFVPDSARPLPPSAPARLILSNLNLSRPPSRQIIYSTGLFAGLFLVSAALAYWYRDTPWSPAAAKVIIPLLNGLEIACGVWALFKLFRVRLMNGLRIGVFAGLSVTALRSYAFILSTAFASQPAVTDAISKLPLHFWIFTIDSALSLIVAVAVLLSLMLTWRDSDSRSSESPL